MDNEVKPQQNTDDLPEAIRKVSRGVDRLLSQGLNRKAVVVLLVHHSKIGHAAVTTVLDSLADLERAYTAKPKSEAKAKRP